MSTTSFATHHTQSIIKTTVDHLSDAILCIVPVIGCDCGADTTEERRTSIHTKIYYRSKSDRSKALDLVSKLDDVAKAIRLHLKKAATINMGQDPDHMTGSTSEGRAVGWSADVVNGDEMIDWWRGVVLVSMISLKSLTGVDARMLTENQADYIGDLVGEDGNSLYTSLE